MLKTEKKNGTVVKQKKAIQGWAQKILSMFDKELNNKHLSRNIQ